LFGEDCQSDLQRLGRLYRTSQAFQYINPNRNLELKNPDPKSGFFFVFGKKGLTHP